MHMAIKILVENLPSDITEDRLMDVFSQIGSVESVKIQTDLLTHRPKGSGYVEMSLDVDAYRAVNCFNGATFKDRKIYVQVAKPFYERAVQVLRQHLNEMTQQRDERRRTDRTN
jgi:RNA recognition motif-containing protein